VSRWQAGAISFYPWSEFERTILPAIRATGRRPSASRGRRGGGRSELNGGLASEKAEADHPTQMNPFRSPRPPQKSKSPHQLALHLRVGDVVQAGREHAHPAARRRGV